MNPAVQGYTAAVLDEVPATERQRVAADLTAVVRLLERNGELLSAITEVSVPARARRAVLEELLEGRVAPAARRIAGYAVGSVRGQEVLAALAWVALRAHQVAEDHSEAVVVLGHLEARRRVGGYAAAVFEDASTGDLEEIEDELFRFSRTVAATPALRSALGDRDLPAEVRRAIVDDLVGAKVRPATLRLLGYAVAAGRPRDVVGTLAWLVEQAAEARGWRIAQVRSGQEVAEDERRKLEATLSRLAGWPVELQVTVEPGLLAGVNVEIGDLQLDATARGRLERLREHVVAGGWTDQGFGHLGRGARGAPPDALGHATQADPGDTGPERR